MWIKVLRNFEGRFILNSFNLEIEPLKWSELQF